MNKYVPKPVDTSGISLPPGIENVIELLSANTHEVWAKKRMDEGWTYGPERNDESKTHPCLVPYDELPEEEKEYDRANNRETLKLLYSMGYKITTE